MPLRGRQHAGGFAIRFAELAVGGARDQATLRLHRRELRRQCSRGERQPVAQRFQGAGGGRFSGDDVEQDARDQRLGFLVPMRLAGFTGRVVDQGVGERHAIVGEIEAVRVDRRERVERSRDEAGDAERIEDMNRAELAALARGDAGVLALGVDADGRERIFEQVGDDRADALAGAGGRDRQQMRGTGIAHRLARLQVAADQQPVIVVEGVRLAGGGEAGRAVRVAGIGIVEPAEQGRTNIQTMTSGTARSMPIKASWASAPFLSSSKYQIASISRRNSAANSTIANRTTTMRWRANRKGASSTPSSAHIGLARAVRARLRVARARPI
ncbi:hypothetical protein GCM10020258_58670 [Sphingomonas yabuuchiae]